MSLRAKRQTKEISLIRDRKWLLHWSQKLTYHKSKQLLQIVKQVWLIDYLILRIKLSSSLGIYKVVVINIFMIF